MTTAVAAFDFDGTLSRRDSLLPFVALVAGRVATAKAVAAAAPMLVAARRDPARRDAAKAAVLRATLAGRRADELRDLGARYARLVVSRHLNPVVLARLDDHRAAGHDLVLVSASLTFYLDPVAARLGIPAVLATEMEVGPDGRLTGAIAGANVRGAEKARRLDEWLGGRRVVVYAYGDSEGDDHLLARADHPVRVDRRGRLPRDVSPVPVESGTGTEPTLR